MEYHSFLFVSDLIMSIKILENGFRLLMEYHSFLPLWKGEVIVMKYFKVSVSLWSIIHSYWSWNGKDCNTRLSWVSVSLRSIIHSYLKDLKTETKLAITGFPSPYGVLFILIHRWAKWVYCLSPYSFRFLMEYHSFLRKEYTTEELRKPRFPSPYGVIFILT